MSETASIRRVVDGWKNLITGVGTALRSSVEQTRFDEDPWRPAAELANLFDADPLANRICTMPPMDMFKRGFSLDIEGDSSGALGDSIMERIAELDVGKAFVDAVAMQRAMGRAGILMMIDDGRTLEKEVAEDAIKAIRWLRVFDARQLRIKDRDDDPLSETFGRPLMYELVVYTSTTGQGGGQQKTFDVHPDRLLIFEDSLVATPTHKVQRDGVISVLSRAYKAIRDYGYAWQSVAELLDSYAVGVWSIGNLRDLIAKDGEATLAKRFSVMDMAKSVARSVILDRENEDFSWRQVSFTAIPDVFDRMAQRVSSTVGIPVTKLYGVSPAGMNATGESDMRNYYDTLVAYREAYVSPELERLIVFLFQESEGANAAEPDVWSIDWPAPWEPTDAERRDAELKAMQMLVLGAREGILEVEEARSAIGPNGSIESVTLDENLFDERNADAPDDELDGDDGPDPFAPREPVDDEEGEEGEAPEDAEAAE